jgi:P2-related tail formation protein
MYVNISPNKLHQEREVRTKNNSMVKSDHRVMAIAMGVVRRGIEKPIVPTLIVVMAVVRKATRNMIALILFFLSAAIGRKKATMKEIVQI